MKEEILPMDAIPLKYKPEDLVPEKLNELTDLQGIKETSDLIILLLKEKKVREALSDGFQFISDSPVLYEVGQAAIDAIVGFSKIWDELTDKITDDELSIINALVMQAGYDPLTKQKIIDGIKLARDIKRYIQSF